MRLLRLESLEGEDIRVEVGVGDRLVADGERRDNGVLRIAELDDDIVDEFAVGYGRSDGRHGVCEGLHLVHVLGGGESLLARRRQLTADVTDIGVTLSAVQGMNTVPHRNRGFATGDHQRAYSGLAIVTALSPSPSVMVFSGAATVSSR